MWEAIHNAFDGHAVFDDVWDIDGIEERADGDPLEPVYGAGFNKTTAQDLEDFWHDK